MEVAFHRRLMPRDEAAQMLHLTDEDIQWLVDTKQLPEIRLRGRKLFDSRDLDQLIDTYKTLVTRRKDKDEALI
jgi:hypothetical protein